MFSLVSLSKSKFFTRVVRVAQIRNKENLKGAL